MKRMKLKLNLKNGGEMMNVIGLLMRFILNYAFSKFVDVVAGLFKRRAKIALGNTKPPTLRAIIDKKKP
jgi:hypothetical protein